MRLETQADQGRRRRDDGVVLAGIGGQTGVDVATQKLDFRSGRRASSWA